MIRKLHINIVTLLCGILVVTGMWSCSKMDANFVDDIIYNTLGEVTYLDTNSGYFEITADNGDLFRVMEYAGQRQVTAGERVYFKYSILPASERRADRIMDDQSIYDIKILLFNDIHCVPILKESFLAQDHPHRSDSIGGDLVRIYDIDFGGHYVNIKFEYFRYENGVDHMINLVWDDLDSEDEIFNLTLRHNAMGETEDIPGVLKSATGLCSFRLADIMPEGEISIDVNIRWNLDKLNSAEYVPGDYSFSTTFTPFGNNEKMGGVGYLTPPADETTFVK